MAPLSHVPRYTGLDAGAAGKEAGASRRARPSGIGWLLEEKGAQPPLAVLQRA